MPTESAIATLGWVARAKGIASKSYHEAAEDWLAANHAPERAQRIVKAPIGAATTGDSDLADYGISLGAVVGQPADALGVLPDTGRHRVHPCAGEHPRGHDDQHADRSGRARRRGDTGVARHAGQCSAHVGQGVLADRRHRHAVARRSARPVKACSIASLRAPSRTRWMLRSWISW